MKNGILLASVAMAAAAHAADVSEIAFTRSEGSFLAHTSSGATTHLRSMHSMLAVPSPVGTPQQAELLVLYDPASGKYLWDHVVVMQQDEGSTKHFSDRLTTFNSALYANKDGIVWFFFSGWNLMVRHSSGVAPSLDAAYHQALHELQAHWLYYVERKGEVVKKSEVWKLVPWDFARGPVPDIKWPLPAPAIEKVTRSGSEWVLNICGRWLAKLIVDQNFEAKSSERIPDPAGCVYPNTPQ